MSIAPRRQGDLGSMLCSLISAIFADFRRKKIGFSLKNKRKDVLAVSKSLIFSPIFFWRKYLKKNITSAPGNYVIAP
jgi:hypothetical protein